MDPIELLATIGYKTAKLDSVSFSTNPNKLGWEDVCGWLAGLPEGPYLTARALWALDHTSTTNLIDYLYMETDDLILMTDDSLYNKCQEAVITFITPNVCPNCGGRHISGSPYTEYWPKGSKLPVQCPDCLGSGKQRMLQQDGLPTLLSRQLSDWANEAISHIYSKFNAS